jgi:putative DNA primase/helicase
LSTPPGSNANPFLTAALAYAAKGWPVFPCRPASSAEVDEKGAPRFKYSSPLIAKGLNAASADADQIRAWWRRWPDAMIGLPLGGPTGLFALDFDPRHDAETGEICTLTQLKAALEEQLGGALPPTIAAKTPSGGVHLFFRQPEGEPVRNRGCLPDHVDVRGLGGYVVAAPSLRFDGAYSWVRGDADTVAAEAPPLLVEILRAPKGSKVVNGVVVPPARGAKAPAAVAGDRPGDASDAQRKYALTALDAECRAVQTAGSGQRNAQLNASAFAVGSLVGAGALSEALALGALREAAAANPGKDSDSQIEATIQSGFKKGQEQKRDLSAIGQRAPARRMAAAAATPAFQGAGDDRGEAPAPPLEDGGFRPSHIGGKKRRRGKRWGPALAWDWVWVWELVAALKDLRRCALLPNTDLGNAERWAILHGAGFRYTEELGWLAWDGKRWKREGGDPRSYPPMLGRSAMATVRHIQAEADYIESTGCPDMVDADMTGVRFSRDGLDSVIKWVGPKDEKVPVWRSQVHRKFGRDCEASGRIGAITALARLQPGVAVSTALFDKAPMLFNVQNGTLELVRGAGGEPARAVLREHAAGDYITKISPAVYDPAAKSPAYDKFLAKVQPDEPMRRFLHAWRGYTLSGDTSEQCFVILHGNQGGNGKSTWELASAHVMGDYALKVNVETFLDGNFEKSGAQASPDIARMPGSRMVYTSEPKAGKRFAEDLIKVITGSESVTARHLNRDFFEFTPEFKISVSCNRPPEASDDPAFWRRVRLTPWLVSLPKAEQDTTLPARLQAEASGILNHFLAGAIDWMTGRLPVPDAVTQATQRYQDESDPLGRFMQAAVRAEAGYRVQSSHLFEVYQAWCAFTGEKDWTQTGFSKALVRKGFEKRQISNMYWIGLRPLFEPEAFAERACDMAGKTIGWRKRDAVDEARASRAADYADRPDDGAAVAASEAPTEAAAAPVGSGLDAYGWPEDDDA